MFAGAFHRTGAAEEVARRLDVARAQAFRRDQQVVAHCVRFLARFAIEEPVEQRFEFEMDQAVAAAYGWTDLDLGHGFHETKQGIRFTISEPARREVLQRLLKLNHERYAEEEKQGLHGKKGTAKKAAFKKKAATTIAKGESSLFAVEED